MKKLIALSALSTVLCVASIGAFAQAPTAAASSTTAKHHHKHHHHHHAHKVAVGTSR